MLGHVRIKKPTALGAISHKGLSIEFDKNGISQELPPEDAAHLCMAFGCEPADPKAYSGMRDSSPEFAQSVASEAKRAEVAERMKDQ